MKGLFNKKKPSKGSDIGQRLIDKNDTTVELQKPQFRRDVQRENARTPTYTSPVVVSRTNSPISSEASVPSKPSISESDHEEKHEPVVEGYKWDFCILVPNPDYVGDKKDGEEKKDEPNAENKIPVGEILERLHLGGLQTYQFYSGDNDEIFIKVRAPLARLMQHAEETGFRLLLDEHYLEKHVDDPLNPIADDPDITRLSPYEYIYGKYIQDKPDMYAKAHGMTHPFSSIVRIKLIMDIIQSNEDNCCALNLRKLAKDGSGSILSYFPLHNDEVRQELTRSWFNFRVSPWEQPIDDVKEYLGEKVALYFEFVGHYTTWLLPLSIAGCLVTLDLIVETAVYGSLDEAILGGYTIPFYCIFVSFWAQLMIEYWKRKQSTKAMEWGTTLFEEEETDRPEFKGELIRSIINGKKMRYFAPAEKAKKIMWSYFIICLMMLLVIACVSAIFGLQYYINYKMTGNPSLQSTGNTGVSILAAVQIIILNMVYSDMAINLTDEENHRTDTDYDDALIGKLFAFSFVNSYASLFFVAFIKHNMGETCNGPCMVELAYQLFVIFASKVTLDKVSTVMTLYVNKWLKERAEKAEYTAAIARGETVEDPSKVELESRLEDYDPSLGTLEDYGQIFIQYGYVTLFVAACPLAPLLAYFSNCIEFRSDGYKMLYFSKRVMPTGAEDIGTWLSILQMTSIAAVITNAGILCYTMKIITFSGVGTVWLFIGFQYTIFVAMAIFAYVVDDIPEYVTLQLQRQDYLADRAEKSAEELAEEAAREKRGNTRLAVVPHAEIHRRDLSE